MEPIAAFNAGIPALGTWVLYAFLVAAACAFGLSIAAATDVRGAAPRYLRAARLAALGTCALIALDVLLLLYAFVSHDFRIRYVMRYSDRSMPSIYLITALWGGQDGSLLWWTFLLSLYTGACVIWLKGRYRELAPYVIATLMTVVMFFGILMAFAANPFSANVAGAPPDGEGLNPSLQNFYMAIHPPSLYIGFVGCAVPFAFAVAALITGRLDEEWIRATRKWALFAWVFLSIGNTLGMLWAYEELGWGGFWAWDPVENAACMPWWTTTAYLHSIMIQERRQSLKIWNVSLIILSFLLTIFGTFLTRSGLIASIHSFAQSEIGTYFLYFLAFAIATSVALIALRYPLLRKPMEIDSVLSREAMFIVNNWLLLGICVFIVTATTWPKVSEWVWHERLTVGASFYNFWLPVPGCVLLAVMGIGTLTPWRKASQALLWRAFRAPVAIGVVVALAHIALGRRLGYPAYVPIDPIYPSAVGRTVAKINSALPPVLLGLIAFNIATIVQEFWRGAEARARAKGEGYATAVSRLVGKNRRRYGGYIVHVGISLMFLGWTGTYWRTEAEAQLRPGQSFNVERYTVRYDRVESRRDPNKREVIAHVTVLQGGREVARLAPAKNVYTTHPDMPTSEVAIRTGLRDDVYVVMASVNATSHEAHLKAFVNPLTLWIWLGCVVLILGTAIAIWPEVSLGFVRGAAGEGDGGSGTGSGGGGGKKEHAEPSSPVGAPAAGVWGRSSQPAADSPRTPSGSNAAMLALVGLATALALYAPAARAQGHTTSAPPPVGGSSEQMPPEERRLFHRMLCMCGDCQRLPLETCTCDFAAAKRQQMREQLRAGVSPDEIVQRYVARYGAAALAVPPDAGHNRMVYALPIAIAVAGGALGIWIVRKWPRNRAPAPPAPFRTPDPPPGARAGANVTGSNDTNRVEYDRRLDEELRGLDD